MSTLQKLYFTKLKAQVRNLFKSKISAIFIIILGLFVIAGFVTIIISGGTISTLMVKDMSALVMMITVVLAILVFITLFSSRKALFYEEDAYYLFSGPFLKKQVMKYLWANTILQAILFGFGAVYFTVFLGSEYDLSIPMYLFLWLFFSLVILFFLTLVDYLYILSISSPKYKNLSRIIAGVIVLVFVGTFLASIIINGTNNNILVTYTMADSFKYVPIFGWFKQGLLSFITGDYLQAVIMLGLMVVTYLVLFKIYISFDGDFYEQALDDAISFSAYYKKVKSGKGSSTFTNKVSNVNGSFKPGAWAILSKNLLMMKKTKSFITPQELLSLGTFIVVTILSDLGMLFLMYFLFLWIMSSIQTSSLMQDLNNMQIYLIPDKPMKKLLALIIPDLVKYSLLTGVVTLGMGLFLKLPLESVLYYVLTVVGFVFVIVCSSVLSVYILRSRANPTLQTITRMLVIAICSLPSILLMLGLLNFLHLSLETSMNILTYSSLVCNIVISFIIILCCKGMMNGRDINSD
ncbi:MAG: putative ABC exporter domain-containing protein [Thomasclavelia sp.]|nr:putative ABC exporter domain-containing protein [Thomasclavelia sp.]